jgi:Zn-finger nucleic acid-binding protein
MGLFFDPGELNALLDKSVDNVYRIDYKKLWEMNQMGSAIQSRSSMYIKCPVCGELMNRTNFGARSGVIIDQCTHGIWLDNGELRKLLEWRKAGGQLLHEKLMKEKEEREAKKQEEAKFGSPYVASNAVFTSDMLSTSRYGRYGNQGEIDLTPLVASAAKAIWRLFTK